MKTEQQQLAECRAHWEATKPDAVFSDYWLGWKAARESLEEPVISSELQAMLAQFEADEIAEIQRAETFVRKTGRASISAIQRNFKIGYERACRIMEKLVELRVVSPIDSEGRRVVLPEGLV